MLHNAALAASIIGSEVTKRILLIEDDLRLADMLKDYLGQAGFHVARAGSGLAGLAALDRDPVDLVVLDLMLPDIDGLEVCQRLCERHEVPVLMLTARGNAMDRVVGLEIGADDYLSKPFEPRELLARIKAILRRRTGGTREQQVLRFGALEIDRDAREVRLEGKPAGLTSYQFELLLAMAEHAGRVLSRDQLMHFVQGKGPEGFDRSIDVHISRIRQAIETDSRKPRRVITVRGAGYVFSKRQD